MPLFTPLRRLIGVSLVLSALAACQSGPVSAPLGSQLGSQNPASLNRLSAQSTAVADLRPAQTGFENFQVVKTAKGQYWENMELLRTPGLPVEIMQDRGRQRDPEVVSCFGNELPPSTDVCLHDAGAPAQLASQIPVLLIHGANVNATSNWATPPYTSRKSGLMQHLKSKGYRVFAVTFANKHGDNFVWVNHIHNAITRIKQITKAPLVDTVAHSKGGFSLRLYTSDVLTPGMKPYQKSVRKALFIGAPQRGIDYTFRHSIVHWALIPEDDDPVKYAPVAWTKAIIYGTWRDASRSNFAGPYFKGQAQMLARWDKTYMLSPTNPDWYTTYNGGKGFVSESPGIDAVIKASGDIVGQMKRSPVRPEIQVGILAGNSPSIPGILNETDGPSDGLALVKSVAAAEDLTAGGAKLLDQTILPMHHLQLIFEPKAMDWVVTQLQK